MKYILMMNTMKAGEAVPNWPKKDLQAHVAFMRSFSKELREAGELVSAEGLAFPDQAKLVSAGKDGAPITDGVFPEGKEFLAGCWIVDVENPERAYAIAAKASAAPGPGGVPLNMPILALYDLLKRMLNHAVSAAMVHGPGKGLELLGALDADARIAGHHRLDAVRAHLLEMSSEHDAAATHYRIAAARTTNLAERNYLMTQTARVNEIAGDR